jgi:hypothetical protein
VKIHIPGMQYWNMEQSLKGGAIFEVQEDISWGCQEDL